MLVCIFSLRDVRSRIFSQRCGSAIFFSEIVVCVVMIVRVVVWEFATSKYSLSQTCYVAAGLSENISGVICLRRPSTSLMPRTMRWLTWSRRMPCWRELSWKRHATRRPSGEKRQTRPPIVKPTAAYTFFFSPIVSREPCPFFCFKFTMKISMH